MNLGNFSVSLNVRDINISKAFYEKLGFIVYGGDIKQNWLILKNGSAIIGLFQGMFDKNILTFNPGWNEFGEKAENYTDIRVIQKELKNKGIIPSPEADESTSGPAHLMFNDPDGNVILIDQHI